ncbi:FtsW/RodA/SpoVE family cell cycle protein [Deinococcus peraridilitoris]|uniref:Bacterial cell division membrane protein n=1 Tax=Deinococcus peraridilitoris (strain DSM 19664 / LMG 22246 / CIP 109416 / KR-200) TaxID=937777 RepID=K9ZZ04_DEIPD|nr:FtsW/RodA/SpoVE family cell cycle protein [Deinococcus peraridilitoris]AFZ66132.1 bacterial cell division membrane protein [Deinococcus peraridilitoris DSM 19664]
MHVAKYDLGLPVLVLLLLGAGLVTVSSVAMSPNLVDQGIFQKQLLGVALAVVPLALLLWAGRDRIYGAAPYLYVLAVVLLLATFVIGKEVNGQRNWLVLGPLQFQPLELAKLSLIVLLPLVMRGGYQGVRSYFWPLLLFLPVLGLVVKEDFGGGMVLAGMLACMLIVWRIPLWHVLLVVLVIGVAFPTVVYPRLKPYQQSRLTIFVNPYEDPKGAGYHQIQSTIAIGSGGMQGKGYGNGTQTHNGFVYSQHSDFVFASWAEEQGFVGAVALLGIFGALFWRLAGMSSDLTRPQDQLLFAGILGQLGVQTVENIGASLSMLPLTGITLPLVSYGLSSLVSVLVTLGLAYVIYRDRLEQI